MTDQDMLLKQAELVSLAKGAINPFTEPLIQVSQLALNWAIGSISSQQMHTAINNIAISTQLKVHKQYIVEEQETENG